jgi:NADPH:quinone reductase-like Zn-dependent oxidoreductase
LEDLTNLIRAGKLKYPSAKAFPMDKTKEAHDLIESRTYSGKIAIDPWL